MPNSRSIAFVVRQNFESKPGGDADLARGYARLATEAGADARIVPFDKLDPADFGLVVSFNLDQPLEAYLMARRCKQMGVRFAIYTLHHKLIWVEKFLRQGTMGRQRQAIQLVGANASRYETLLGVARQVGSMSLGNLAKARSADRMQRYILENAWAVVVACPGEARTIEQDFEVKLERARVIPHYFAADTSRIEAAQGIDLVNAGRIEPRKNQLALALAVEAVPDRSILFVGKKNPKHTEYLAAFDEVVARCERVRWVDHVSLETLKSYLRGCRTYIAASWFEVFSLVDLMAMSYGCHCVFSQGSYLYDELGSAGAAFADPSDLSNLAQLLEVADQRSVTLPDTLHVDGEQIGKLWQAIEEEGR